MTEPTSPGRRRWLVPATAALTALATIAGLGALAASSSPSLASPVSPPAAPTAAAVAPITLTPTDPPSSGASESATPSATPSASAAAEPGEAGLAGVRNVVLVLADDLDWQLFQQVPRLAALQDEGLTFTNHVVTDSLCCPSRASILRSQYIHNHGVVSNSAASGGGWPTFRARGWHEDCLPVWLQSAGVTTGLYGKFLNDYPERARAARYVPPGWSKWGVPTSRGESYSGYDYVLNENGRLRSFGKRPSAFLNDVITSRASEFVRTAPEGFFLTLSTYNPHNPSPVALRNKGTHVATVAPRTPNYNVVGTNEPSWMTDIPVLNTFRQEKLDRVWRKRAASAESVADSVDAIRASLAASGRTDDTLIVITSDNGYHAGAHRMTKGKRTAFREDTVVPLVVIGPGITPGTRVDAVTSTIDLGPTFTDLLGAQAPAWVDGRSLVDIMRAGEAPSTWRTAVLSESMGMSGPDDPDYQPEAPPPYTALRSKDWLFVVYRNGERELYDLRNDPYEMNNIASTADTRLVASLYSQMQAMRSCTGDSCRTSDALVPVEG